MTLFSCVLSLSPSLCLNSSYFLSYLPFCSCHHWSCKAPLLLHLFIYLFTHFHFPFTYLFLMDNHLNLFNIYPFEHMDSFKHILLMCIFFKNSYKCHCAIVIILCTCFFQRSIWYVLSNYYVVLCSERIFKLPSLSITTSNTLVNVFILSHL